MSQFFLFDIVKSSQEQQQKNADGIKPKQRGMFQYLRRKCFIIFLSGLMEKRETFVGFFAFGYLNSTNGHVLFRFAFGSKGFLQ